MTKSLYLIGGPGSGKSTLMARLLEGWEVGPFERWGVKEMFGHYLTHPQLGTAAYLGHLRPEYPGTDALSLSVAPQAMKWLEALPLLGLDWVFGEGIRLSHMEFLLALSRCTELTVVHLDVDPDVAAARRAARPGKKLSEAYCKNVTSRAESTAKACREAGLNVLSGTTSGILDRGVSWLHGHKG